MEWVKVFGFSIFVVMFDTWLFGWRLHDFDAVYLLFLIGEGLVIYFSDLVFCASLVKPPLEDF